MIGTEAAEREGIINDAYIYTQDIGRYFNAEKYFKKGSMRSISLSDQLSKLNSDKMLYHVKAISLNDISYYSNRFIDTSNIDIIDLGEHLSNYHVEHD